MLEDLKTLNFTPNVNNLLYGNPSQFADHNAKAFKIIQKSIESTKRFE